MFRTEDPHEGSMWDNYSIPTKKKIKRRSNKVPIIPGLNDYRTKKKGKKK